MQHCILSPVKSDQPKTFKLTSMRNKTQNNKTLAPYKHAIQVYGNNSMKITQRTKIKPIQYAWMSEGFSGKLVKWRAR